MLLIFYFLKPMKVFALSEDAQALGLGCIAQASLAGYPDFVRRHFALPDDRLVVCGVSFGYADHRHPVNGFRSKRANLAQVVHWVGH